MGTRVDCYDKDYRSVVRDASYRRSEGEYIKAYKLLIDKVSKNSINKFYNQYWNGRIDRKYKPLFQTKDKERFKILIKAGTNINEPTYYNQYNEPSNTPLEIAIDLDDIELIKLVLEMGGDINLVYNKISPIDYAHSNRKDNAEMYLLENGAKYVKY